MSTVFTFLLDFARLQWAKRGFLYVTSKGLVTRRLFGSPQPGSRKNRERDGILVRDGIGKGAGFNSKIPQSRYTHIKWHLVFQVSSTPNIILSVSFPKKFSKHCFSSFYPDEKCPLNRAWSCSLNWLYTISFFNAPKSLSFSLFLVEPHLPLRSESVRRRWRKRCRLPFGTLTSCRP